MSRDSADSQKAVPYHTPAEFNKLDVELGKEKITNVLGNYYLAEQEAAVKDLIEQNPGITGSEPMEVDSEEVEPTPGLPNCPMDNEPDSSTRTFRLDIAELGYTPSLVGSQDSPPSLVTAQENALLDDSESGSLTQNQPKAPGTGRLEGSSSMVGMTLWKRKT